VELFDPATLADLKFRAKKQLRTRMRGLRAAHPEAVLAQASERIVERVLALPQFRAARGVYYPYLLPKPGGFETGFREVRSVSELADRGQRFFEPPPDAPRAERGQLDLLVVPALAAAADGQRLGYGSGFYDATLPDFCPPASALAVIYDFQLLGELPATDSDFPCNWVVTDRRLLERSALASP
jgi:5-formyltetrahydrofolate cyclo-ligase